MAAIPKDAAMLLSYVNTQLRDFYPSLEEMCASLDLDEDEIKKSLASIDYTYDETANRFV